jgi:allantoinase
VDQQWPAGVLGMKAFLCPSGIDEFPNASAADLRAVMPTLAAAGRPLLVHAELTDCPADIPAGVADDPRSYRRHLHSRPASWEADAVDLLADLGRAHRCPTHVVHLSGTAALPRLARERADGLPLTVETCPHYLFFAAEEIPDGDPRFKCAPPIRGRAEREGLWEAVRAGLIDTIGSDHSPAPPDLKHLDTGDLVRAWGGIASLQLALPVVWTAASRRGFTVADLARWLAARPAELVGLADRKGAIAPGRDADLVVFDPEATFTVGPETLHHRHKATPYEGQVLRGRVVKTLLRGRPVYDAGRFADAPAGRPLLRPLGRETDSR